MQSQRLNGSHTICIISACGERSEVYTITNIALWSLLDSSFRIPDFQAAGGAPPRGRGCGDVYPGARA